MTLPNSVEKKWDSTSVVVQRKLCHLCYKHLFFGLFVLVVFIVYALTKSSFVLFSQSYTGFYRSHTFFYCWQHCSDLNTAFILAPGDRLASSLSVKFLL